MKSKSKRSRPILRKVEARVGVPLADLLGKMELKTSKLVGPKTVHLPKSGIDMHYYEREAKIPNPHGFWDCYDIPTLIFFHGIGSHGREFCSFLSKIKIPPTVRILVPEMIGHGEDLKRVQYMGLEFFQQPDGVTLLNAASEFLDVLEVDSNCNALGTSLGGALLYFLKKKRPDKIQKTVLVAPALPHFLEQSFLDGLINGKHRFLDFQSREDVKRLFRDILWTNPERRRKNGWKLGTKKNPFPPCAYEVIYRLALRDVPEGHFRALQDKLIAQHGRHMMDHSESATDDETDDETETHKSVMNSNGALRSILRTAKHDESAKHFENSNEETRLFQTTTDVDRKSPRLVLWPEEDQIINLEKGKAFFGPAIKARTTTFRTIPECGHVFDAKGTNIYDLIRPIVTDYLLDLREPKCFHCWDGMFPPKYFYRGTTKTSVSGNFVEVRHGVLQRP